MNTTTEKAIEDITTLITGAPDPAGDRHVELTLLALLNVFLVTIFGISKLPDNLFPARPAHSYDGDILLILVGALVLLVLGSLWFIKRMEPEARRNRRRIETLASDLVEIARQGGDITSAALHKTLAAANLFEHMREHLDEKARRISYILEELPRPAKGTDLDAGSDV